MNEKSQTIAYRFRMVMTKVLFFLTPLINTSVVGCLLRECHALSLVSSIVSSHFTCRLTTGLVLFRIQLDIGTNLQFKNDHRKISFVSSQPDQEI